MTEMEGVNPNGSSKIPSRFIFEIKENLYDRIGVIEESFYEERLSQIEYINATVLGEAPADGFQIDDQVEHPVFGKGVITEVDARSRTYVVKFEGMEIQKPISFDFKRMTKLKGG